MSWAICTSCGRDVHWRNQRGARIANQRCPDCGGTIKAARTGEYTTGRTTKGATALVCSVCGRRRFRYIDRILESAHTYWDGQRVEVPVGALVCRSHVPTTGERWARSEPAGTGSTP